LPQSFVVDEEEALVTSDWPAKRAAELMAVEIRWFTGIEEVFLARQVVRFS
jgi:hypothetical protein